MLVTPELKRSEGGSPNMRSHDTMPTVNLLRIAVYLAWESTREIHVLFACAPPSEAHALRTTPAATRVNWDIASKWDER